MNSPLEAPAAGSIADLLAIVAVLLGIVTILLAVGGIFAFLNVRANARAAAKEEAQSVAEEMSESAAVAYLQREMPALIKEYMDLARSAANDATADDVAEEQEDEQ